MCATTSRNCRSSIAVRSRAKRTAQPQRGVADDGADKLRLAAVSRLADRLREACPRPRMDRTQAPLRGGEPAAFVQHALSYTVREQHPAVMGDDHHADVEGIHDLVGEIALTFRHPQAMMDLQRALQ